MKTDIFIHGGVNIPKRVVFESSGGKHISYENIWIDTFKKIVDEGSYKAKIYIDLSNFGYFKILETEIFFEVMD
jgi:esterase/lipase superfamily enzyme